jgi:hypothetical protein
MRAPVRRARSVTVRAMAGGRTVINTDKAPAALGPYSQANRVRSRWHAWRLRDFPWSG